MNTVRAILFYIFWALSLLILLPLVLVVLPLPPIVSKRLGGVWAFVVLLGLRIFCGVRVRFTGTQYISKTPALYVSKHQSTLETLALATVINNTTGVLKKTLFAIPVFGWFLWRSGMIGINRKKGIQSVKKMRTQCKQAMQQGRNLIIFPEGTRTAVGAEPQYKTGVYDMYNTLNVAVIPIALNTGQYWHRHTIVKTAGTATIQFLPPIAPGLSKQQFMDTIQHEIETATDALCAK